MVRPGRRLGAGGAQHPFADRHDQPGLLGQRDEVGRRDTAARRAVPAHQRLEAGDPVFRQVVQRLVVQLELAALQREPQIRLQPRRACSCSSMPGSKKAKVPRSSFARYSATSARLQQCRRRTRRVGQRDADAGADDDVVALHVIGCADRRRRAGSRARRAGAAPPVGSASDDGELVAAEPRDHVVVAHAVAQPRRHLPQQLVAGRMAKRVVDVLEVVEIEAQHARTGRFALPPAAASLPCAPGTASGSAGRSARRGAP